MGNGIYELDQIDSVSIFPNGVTNGKVTVDRYLGPGGGNTGTETDSTDYGPTHILHGGNSFNFGPGWHEWTYRYEDGCNEVFASGRVCANSAPELVDPLTYYHQEEIYINNKLMLDTSVMFTDVDNATDIRIYSFNAGISWPSWLKLNPENGFLVGLSPDAGTFNINIIVTD